MEQDCILIRTRHETVKDMRPRVRELVEKELAELGVVAEECFFELLTTRTPSRMPTKLGLKIRESIKVYRRGNEYLALTRDGFPRLDCNHSDCALIVQIVIS